MQLESFLPQKNQLENLLQLESGESAALSDLFDRSLFDPLRTFLSRPGKKIRTELVELGLRIAHQNYGELTPDERLWCARAGEILEGIHAGSLVVDDIEDASTERRGKPTLHLSHGVPLALNAGNWLYFWPFEKIRSWRLSAPQELSIYQLCHRALLRAHFGQAIDVGTSIDLLEQGRIESVCLASLELKTGALSSLAVALGAAVGAGEESTLAALSGFGLRFGVALQMFDDIGNLKSRSGAKRFEDVRLKRPTWVWAVAAKRLSPAAFVEFRRTANLLPEAGPFLKGLDEGDILARAKEEAEFYLAHARDKLREDFAQISVERGAKAVAFVSPLVERLSHAYE